jgi:hypothetical protein
VRSFCSNPRNLFILGLLVCVGASFSEVMRGRDANFRIFSQATQLFWQGIAPYGSNWAAFTAGLDTFLYGPLFNVLFAPFAFLPKWLGPFVWNVMNYVLYFVAVFTLPDKFGKAVKCKIFLYTFLILAASMLSFQANIMVAYVFVFSFSLMERNKPLGAVALILLSGFIKVYGLFQLALLLCYPKFWRNMLYVVAVALVFVLLPAVNLQIEDWTAYYGDWISQVMGHKDTRPWQTFFYMQPWRNISFASVYIQAGTLLALAALFCANYKRFRLFEFRAQSLGILMSWMVLFSNAADTHTHLITMLGYLLWYWNRDVRTTLDRIIFYVLFVVVIVVPIDLLCPPVVMRFLFHTLSLHLWLLTLNLMRMCGLTFVRGAIPQRTGAVLDKTAPVLI